MNLVIAQRLLLVLAAVALLSFAGRRKWITPNETGWVGASVIFAASGWVLQAVLNITRADFSNRLEGILSGVALTIPLIISLIAALVILVKKLNNDAR
jgi:hypothetical protein